VADKKLDPTRAVTHNEEKIGLTEPPPTKNPKGPVRGLDFSQNFLGENRILLSIGGTTGGQEGGGERHGTKKAGSPGESGRSTSRKPDKEKRRSRKLKKCRQSFPRVRECGGKKKRKRKDQGATRKAPFYEKLRKARVTNEVTGGGGTTLLT